jgi:hypothetical protein
VHSYCAVSAKPFQDKTSRNILEPLDTLTVSEARRLLTMLALENGGYDPTNREECHCSHCSHKHKKRGNTPSLSIKPKRKPKDENESIEDVQVGRLQCRGSCGFEASLEAEGKRKKTASWKLNSISKYLEGVLPDPSNSSSWKLFWTSDKVQEVVRGLKSRERFSLGLFEFKKNNGFPCPPGSRDASDVLHNSRSFGSSAAKSPGGFLCEWTEMFGDALEVFDANPQLGMTVCRQRGWKASTLRSLVKDGLVSVKPSQRHEGDIVLAFAYKGLVESPTGLPCRLIKTRHLFATPETDPFSRRTIHPGVFSALLCDFTSSSTLLQTAKRVVFVEGEPDAISWRHMHPEDGIVCVGDVNEYKPILECLPTLNLAGKEVVYVHDRDQDSEGKPKMSEDGLASHHSILTAISEQKPAKIMLWMCPQIGKEEMKDPNDFLKKSGRAGEILKYAEEVYSSSGRPLSLPSYKKTFYQLFQKQLA